ncbi:PDDEXK-like family protein [Jatrophihabitans fulvus]
MAYTNEELAAAIVAARSWRDVLRRLGLTPTSAGSLRAARRRADDLALDYSHFTGQRRWSDSALADAVTRSRSWTEVAGRLGLFDGDSIVTVRGHAARLALDTAHLAAPVVPPDTATGEPPRPEFLRRAAPNLAAAWFLVRGHAVSWPLEPARYDLLVDSAGRLRRVQVKTTVARAKTKDTVSLSTSRRVGRQTYAHDEIDSFFVVDSRLDGYLIPVEAVAGRYSITLAPYARFCVLRRGDLLTTASASPAP